jgi:hypothetical protein
MKNLMETIAFAKTSVASYKAAMANGKVGFEDLGLIVEPFKALMIAIEDASMIGGEFEAMSREDHKLLSDAVVELVYDIIDLFPAKEDAVEAGTKEIDDILAALHAVAAGVKTALANGKFDLGDIGLAIPAFDSFKEAIEGVSGVKAEIKDLDEEEAKALSRKVLDAVYALMGAFKKPEVAG